MNAHGHNVTRNCDHCFESDQMPGRVNTDIENNLQVGLSNQGAKTNIESRSLFILSDSLMRQNRIDSDVSFELVVLYFIQNPSQESSLKSE